MSGQRYIVQHSPRAAAFFVVDVEADEVVLSTINEPLAHQVVGILEAGDSIVALLADQRQAIQALMIAAEMPGSSEAVLPSLAEVAAAVIAQMEAQGRALEERSAA